MSISNRLKKLENAANRSDACQCAANGLATSKEAFIAPQKCAECRGIIKPSVLVVNDLSEIEDFNCPVKIYAGFDGNLV